ncbi:MAG: DUF916 domain-containing protein [Ilumatobacteraceae bacterium]
MNSRRRLAVWAATASMAILVPAASAMAGSAKVPPTEPPTDQPAATPTDQPAAGEPVELVESWALSPAGSLDADAAGLRPDLTYEASPGAVIEDAVTVFNLGNVPMTFHVYATDAFNNADGQFDLLPGDQQPVDVGSWVTFQQELVTVPPGKQVTMPITIKVPADATPGDHTGAVLASNESVGTGEEGSAVTLDRRTGTRLYLRVSGELTPELAVDNVETSYRHALNSLSGSADVTYRIENRGNTRMSGTASLTITGPFGLAEKKVPLPDVPELLPGQHINVKVSVDDVPALMLAFTTVRVEPAGAAGGAAAAGTSGKDLAFDPPLSFLLVLLFLLLGLLARRAYVRHRGPAAAVDEESERAEQPEREHQPA